RAAWLAERFAAGFADGGELLGGARDDRREPGGAFGDGREDLGGGGLLAEQGDARGHGAGGGGGEAGAFDDDRRAEEAELLRQRGGHLAHLGRLQTGRARLDDGERDGLALEEIVSLLRRLVERAGPLERELLAQHVGQQRSVERD